MLRLFTYLICLLLVFSDGLMAQKKHEKEKKNNPNSILKQIEVKQTQILSTQDQLKQRYGTTMDMFLEKREELDEIRNTVGEKSKSYKIASEELDEIRNSRTGFQKESEGYLRRLNEMDHLVNKLSNEVKADFKKDYYQKYQKYSSKRPAVRDIKLDSRLWMSILDDPKDFKLIKDLISVNKLLYSLSIGFTDAYFTNAPEKVYLDQKQADWEGKHMEMIRKNASEDEIKLAYSDYAKQVTGSSEYQQLVAEQNRNRERYINQLTRTSVNELTRTLPALLNTSKALSMKRPASIPEDQYYGVIIQEAAKVAQIITMTSKTIQGTTLITRQAVKSGVINLQIKKASRKTSAFIMENKNIELIVISDGKNQRYQIVSKSTDDRRASLGESLREKNESVAQAYNEQKYKDIRVGIAQNQLQEDL